MAKVVYKFNVGISAGMNQRMRQQMLESKMREIELFQRKVQMLRSQPSLLPDDGIEQINQSGTMFLITGNNVTDKVSSEIVVKLLCCFDGS